MRASKPTSIFCKVQEREILPGDNSVASSPHVASAALLPAAHDDPDFFSLFSVQKEKSVLSALVPP